MKKLFLGSAALLLLAGAASAADLPVKAMPVKAPPVVMYDWNGFYVGGYFGDSIGESKTHTDPPGVAGTHSGVNRFNDKGLTFGLTAGYNWQFDPRWLVGIEGDIGWLDIDRTNIEWNDLPLVGLKTTWYGTLRGRFGYVTGPSLLYVTGGGAWVHLTDTFGGGGGSPAITNSSTPTGWTVGAGIETKLSRAWTAKTEYLFVDAGNANFASNPYVLAASVPTTVDHSFHVIKTGLNYKIGEPFLEGLPLFGTSAQLPSNHNWGGFYAGVNVGGGISNIHTIGGSGTQTAGSEQDVNGTGFAAGGHFGYNWMNVMHVLGSSWFLGAEGDIGYLGVHGSEADWFDTTRIFSDTTNWYATARARVGTSTGPALLYMTGGAAWVHLTDTMTNGPAFVSTGSRTAGGWTIGGGLETALNERWSARIESLYMDVGHHVLIPGPGSLPYSDFKDRFTVVRAGVTYQLGGW